MLIIEKWSHSQRVIPAPVTNMERQFAHALSSGLNPVWSVSMGQDPYSPRGISRHWESQGTPNLLVRFSCFINNPMHVTTAVRHGYSAVDCTKRSINRAQVIEPITGHFRGSPKYRHIYDLSKPLLQMKRKLTTWQSQESASLCNQHLFSFERFYHPLPLCRFGNCVPPISLDDS